MLLLLALATAPVVQAEEEDEGPTFDFLPGDPWVEGAVSVPAYPEAGRLVPVDLGVAGSRFRAFLDPASLELGDDGVIRYTLVLRAASGAENALYEGVRCATRAYRTYAAGVDGRFVPAQAPKWRRITERGSGRYRYNLYRYYLCDPDDRAYPVAEILRRVRYGGTEPRGPSYDPE